MSVTPDTAASTGRNKPAQGKERSDAALGHASQNTSSPAGAKQGGELPSGWRWKTIPDLVTEDGVFIDGDWVESKDQDPNGDVRLIQLADVGDGVYRDKSDRFMTKAKADALRCTFLKDGDVLIARMPDPLGRACIFPGDAKPSVTVVDVAIVRSGNGEFDHRWLACFVNAHPFRSAISGLQAGSTRKRISRGNLATIPLPVPPLPEQRRIVAEIEKQFTRLEAGVAALRRVQANLKRYRAAVLKAACEGRLVPTEAELAKTDQHKATYETGEQLLARILKERRDNWQGRGKYREPEKPETNTLCKLPNGWAWASPEEVSSNEVYSFAIGPFGSNLKVSDYTTSGVPLVFVRNIRASKFGDSSTIFVSKAKADDLRAQSISGGYILITKMGAPPGDACLYPISEPEAIITADCIKLRLTPLLPQKHFFVHVINSELVKPQLKLITKGVAQMKVSLGRFSTIAFPLPPLAEQTRIVAEVERRLSVIDELATVVTTNLQRATRLRQSILQKAFTGQLV